MTTAVLDAVEAEAVARDVLRRHLGGRAGRLERQGRSRNNLVFAARMRDGEEVIVRLSSDPSRGDAYRRERWATARAVAAGVPTPQVLVVGDGPPHPFMIERRAPGREASDHPDRHRILRDLGALAAVINAIAAPGYGTACCADDAAAGHPTWAAYLRDELRLEARLATLARLGGVGEDRLDRLRAILARADDGVAAPTLNHGDLRLKNVLVDERGRITALIDWEDCCANLPAWELSLALHDLPIDGKDAFLAGYGLDPALVAAAAPVMKAINLINYAPALERAADDPAALGRLRLRLSGALDLYSP